MAAEFTCADRERLVEFQEDEIIFLDNPGRWVLLPVEFPTIFKFYKALENQYWTPGPLIWDREVLKTQISGRESKSAGACSLAVYCILIDLKLYKGILGCENIDSVMYMDVLDQLCGITSYIQSPEGRAFIGFQNMLEDFHREALNGALSALLSGTADPTGAISPDVCVPHVRHTWSKALWVYNHLNGLAIENTTQALAGDKLANVKFEASSRPCLPEALIALTVSRCVFNVCGVMMISKWTSGSHRQGEAEGGGSIEALNKFLSHFIKDMHLFADFYAHLYSNLKHKLTSQCLFELLSEAVILEYQYLCTVFHELIACGVTDNAALGSLTKAAVLRVASACGEAPSAFESFYLANETRLVKSIAAICWSQVECQRGSKYDNSSLPFVMFTEVPGDWLGTRWPILSYDSTECGYHTTQSDQRGGESKLDKISSNTTAASALEKPLINGRMEFDDDF